MRKSAISFCRTITIFRINRLHQFLIQRADPHPITFPTPFIALATPLNPSKRALLTCQERINYTTLGLKTGQPFQRLPHRRVLSVPPLRNKTVARDVHNFRKMVCTRRQRNVISLSYRFSNTLSSVSPTLSPLRQPTTTFFPLRSSPVPPRPLLQ